MVLNNAHLFAVIDGGTVEAVIVLGLILAVLYVIGQKLGGGSVSRPVPVPVPIPVRKPPQTNYAGLWLGSGILALVLWGCSRTGPHDKPADTAQPATEHCPPSQQTQLPAVQPRFPERCVP